MEDDKNIAPREAEFLELLARVPEHERESVLAGILAISAAFKATKIDNEEVIR